MRPIPIIIGASILTACSALFVVWVSEAGQSGSLIWPFDTPADGTVSPFQGTIRQTTEVSNAQLVPASELSLSFTISGTVAAVSAEEGSLTVEGQELISLDTDELELERQRAAAVYKQHQANVRKLLAGTRPEELSIVDSRFSKAKTALGSSRKALIAGLKNGFSMADDAVRDNADRMLSDPSGESPQIAFALADGNLEADIERLRKDIEDDLRDWKNDIDDLDTKDDMAKASRQARDNIDRIRKFFDDLASAVDTLSAGGSLTQETLDSWKASLSAGREMISAASASLETSLGGYRDAGQDLIIAESQFTLAKAGAMSQDIDIARFQLEEAERAESISVERLGRARLSAPASGLVIKKIHIDKDEYASANQPVIELASPKLEMRIDIPEEDMGSIAVGDDVSLALDSFPDAAPLKGKIISIESQEITRNGSTYFRAAAQLDSQPEGCRSGMSGDATIYGPEKHSAMLIPRSAIRKDDGATSVWVIGNGSEASPREVSIGIRNGQLAEVIGGLSMADTILRHPDDHR